MSTLSQFMGSPLTSPPLSIINKYSSGGVQSDFSLACEISVATLSGALTANTYKELIGIPSGAGVVTICAVRVADTTSRTLGLQVIIDGVTVFDAVSDAITSNGVGIIAIGGGVSVPSSTVTYLLPEPIVFNNSLSISVKSSLSETNKVALLSAYRIT